MTKSTKTSEADEWSRSFEETINDARTEHLLECEGSGRCLLCRIFDNKNDLNRIEIARLEYKSKVKAIDTRTNLLCVYCGGIWDQRDHLLPKGWSGEGLRSLVPTVPSCRSCNQTISDFPSPVIAERALYVAKRLRTKKARVLKGKQWTEDEILELEGNTRQRIRAFQSQRNELRTRICVLELGGLPEVPTEWIKPLSAGEYSTFFNQETQEFQIAC